MSAMSILKDREYLPVTEILNLPDYVADTSKLSKEFVIKDRLTRFNNTI